MSQDTVQQIKDVLLQSKKILITTTPESAEGLALALALKALCQNISKPAEVIIAPNEKQKKFDFLAGLMRSAARLVAFHASLVIQTRRPGLNVMIAMAGDTLGKLPFLGYFGMDTFKEIFFLVHMAFPAGLPDPFNPGRHSPMAAVARRALRDRQIFFLKKGFPVNAGLISLKNVGRMTIRRHQLLFAVALIASVGEIGGINAAVWI